MLARAMVISRLRPPLAALILAIGMAFDAPAPVDAVPLPLHDRHGIDPEIPALRGLATGDRPYEVDLFRAGDFVSQSGPTTCIPASILTMGRIIDDGAAATARRMTQARLYRLARRLSTPRLVGAGAEAEGWAGALNRVGYGPYVVRVARTRAEALVLAARAIRSTGRPVGLLVWRGAHAWLMTGFRATGDPLLRPPFVVTHVDVVDPWYPRSSATWGRSPRPGMRLSVATLAADFLPFRRPTVRYPDKDGRFVLVLPVLAAG